MSKAPRLIVDESTGHSVSSALRELGCDVDDEHLPNRIAIARHVITTMQDRLPGHFIVATERSIRIRQLV